MSVAKAKAKQVLKDLHIDSPELLRYLKEICCERGAYVREGKLESAEARLVVDGDKGIITVNKDAPYVARTRFSMAHELGHFELHRRQKAAMSCDQEDLNEWSSGRQAAAQMEREANEFASELLLPEALVKSEIQGNKPSIGLIERLARKFQTSLFATAKRFTELTPEACAVVFFKQNLVQYAWKSSLFFLQRYRIVDKIDPYSYAYEALAGNETPDFMSSVDATTWLEVPAWLEEESILEEARYFPSLKMGISLLWMHRGALIRY